MKYGPAGDQKDVENGVAEFKEAHEADPEDRPCSDPRDQREGGGHPQRALHAIPPSSRGCSLKATPPTPAIRPGLPFGPGWGGADAMV